MSSSTHDVLWTVTTNIQSRHMHVEWDYWAVATAWTAAWLPKCAQTQFSSVSKQLPVRIISKVHEVWLLLCEVLKIRMHKTDFKIILRRDNSSFPQEQYLPGSSHKILCDYNMPFRSCRCKIKMNDASITCRPWYYAHNRRLVAFMVFSLHSPAWGNQKYGGPHPCPECTEHGAAKHPWP